MIVQTKTHHERSSVVRLVSRVWRGQGEVFLGTWNGTLTVGSKPCGEKESRKDSELCKLRRNEWKTTGGRNKKNQNSVLGPQTVTTHIGFLSSLFRRCCRVIKVNNHKGSNEGYTRKRIIWIVNILIHFTNLLYTKPKYSRNQFYSSMLCTFPVLNKNYDHLLMSL